MPVSRNFSNYEEYLRKSISSTRAVTTHRNGWALTRTRCIRQTIRRTTDYVLREKGEEGEEQNQFRSENIESMANAEHSTMTGGT